jgi:Calcineurin-like phosphoesterase
VTTALIHLSDFHYAPGFCEKHTVVLDELFKDLNSQLVNISAEKVFVVFSGDILQSGNDKFHYLSFKEEFSERLAKLNVSKDQIIVVPGNHDLSRNLVEEHEVTHAAIVSKSFNEEEFNDFINKSPNIFLDKFSIYCDFEFDFAKFGVGKGRTGSGWSIDSNIGVYCLNTALFSNGGHGNSSDKGRLCIDTRSIHSWISGSDDACRVLVMHHPLSWLADPFKSELKNIINKHFNVVLFGHEHQQGKLHSIVDDKQLIECCSPALFSAKKDKLGYSILLIDGSSGPKELIYRQWTDKYKFVSGVDFSNSDDGKVSIEKSSDFNKLISNTDNIFLKHLQSRLDESLVSYSGQPVVWVNPIVKEKPEMQRDEQSIESIELKLLIEKPSFTIIYAPPQFGLTCLAHYLVKEAWEKLGNLWLYFDVNNIKPGTVKGEVAKYLSNYDLNRNSVKCIVVDSVSSNSRDSWKIVSRLIDEFPSVPVICMHTMDATSVADSRSCINDLKIEFKLLYVWSLTRNLIRGMVEEYNHFSEVGEDDVVITKIVSDLEMLNLHRTPLNCLTLLKVSEADFDESPVNRCEVIKRILFLLFNGYDIPNYKAKPDLKDCEFVLGYFCESLIKSGDYVFSRTHFISILERFCRDALIDLEVHVVFDVLSANNILIQRDGGFSFKFLFWIYYFSALRMHHDESFAKYMLENSRYSNMPELIEFYTGVDRQREDALITLTKDLTGLRINLETRCGLPESLDPYRLAQWQSSEATLLKMQAEIDEGVKESNLPSEIKDRFADQSYDHTRPYDQNISSFAEESISSLMQTLRAASKGLRNSDYVKPNVKRELLEEILRCWEQLTKVLLVIVPILADKGHAVFDGASFALVGDFGKDLKERVNKILTEIPTNVVFWSRDDLHSHKMGPLFLDVFNNEVVHLKKHELALFLISQRPKGWVFAIQDYISSIQKNSFYLLDVYRSLRTQYRYSHVNYQTLSDIKRLIQMAATKHVTGVKVPGIKLINKTIPKLKGPSVIPDREV